METKFRDNKQEKAANKRILFLIDINSDSPARMKGFVKKICFHYAEKLLSPAGISKNGFQ